VRDTQRWIAVIDYDCKFRVGVEAMRGLDKSDSSRRQYANLKFDRRRVLVHIVGWWGDEARQIWKQGEKGWFLNLLLVRRNVR